MGGRLGIAHEAVRLAFPIALEAAIDTGDPQEADRLADLLATRPTGEIPPFLRAQVARARALLTAAGGDDAGVEENLIAAESTLRDLGYPYWTARAQLDRAEWIAGKGRQVEAASIANQAAEIFERLGTQPMLLLARTIAMAGVS